MKWQRNKKYVIKELSQDGLLKDPIRVQFWDNGIWGYTEFKTEDEAWEAIEKEVGQPTHRYQSVSYVVITEFELESKEEN